MYACMCMQSPEEGIRFLELQVFAVTSSHECVVGTLSLRAITVVSSGDVSPRDLNYPVACLWFCVLCGNGWLVGWLVLFHSFAGDWP